MFGLKESIKAENHAKIRYYGLNIFPDSIHSNLKHLSENMSTHWPVRLSQGLFLKVCPCSVFGTVSHR